MSTYYRYSPRRTLLAVGAVVALAGCSDSPSEPEPVLDLTVDGWLERGGEADLSLTVDGAAVAASAVEWSFDPAGSATMVEDGRVRFQAVGPLTIRARVPEGVDSVRVDVAAPPAIVFDRSVEGNRDLWRVELDGEGLTRLTTHGASDQEASVADGDIVFVSFRDGNAELYAMPVAGGDARRLTTSGHADQTPALAADGGRVAYSNDADGTPQLWLLDLASGGPQRAHPEPESGIVHTSPDWRPGANELAYVTTTSGTADIHLLNAGGGASTPLVEGPHAEVEPAWDVEGERLAFVSNRDGDTELYLLDVASGDVERLTRRTGSDSHPTWLADGRIVYVAGGPDGPTLRWLHPDAPERTVEIPGSAGAARPAALR